MSAFWSVIEWIMYKLRTIGAACLVGMMSLTCVDVVGRFFGHPVFGSVELVSFMATLSVAMALPYTHKVGGHVGVEIIVRLVSERKQAVIAICTGILSLVLFSIVTWRMVTYARTMQLSGEVSLNLELPQHYIIYATGFCFFVFTLIILQELILNIRKLKST
jgi:TRAP-type C4-dicarboxylate transport system permease small subunit